MQIELDCPRCDFLFSAAPETPSCAILDRLTEEGPWMALGDGETFEDMIFSALTARGRICCPECRAAVSVNEASLGPLTRELFPCH